MKAKIVKNTYDHAWYKYKTGRIYDVEESIEYPDYYVTLICGVKYHINKKDVEIIKDKTFKNKINKVEIQEYQPHVVSIFIKEKGEVIDIQNVHVEAETVKVIHNDNIMVVILNDGSKGVSRCLPTDEYDEQKGYDIAYYRAVIAQCKKELDKLIK